MSAPDGAIVKLHYDCTSPPGPTAGDLLLTHAGTCYLVVEARTSARRGTRTYLTAVKNPARVEPRRDRRDFQLNWYPRKRKARIS